MLKGNYSKYKTMTMQNKREITKPTMNIQVSEIESTEKLTLLGVTIDSKLNFNHHISNVCKKERGLRTVFNNKLSSYEKLLTQADIPSLYNR